MARVKQKKRFGLAPDAGRPPAQNPKGGMTGADFDPGLFRAADC